MDLMSWVWVVLAAIWAALGVYYVRWRYEIAERSGRGTTPSSPRASG
jgi:hypothetical protein